MASVAPCRQPASCCHPPRMSRSVACSRQHMRQGASRPGHSTEHRLRPGCRKIKLLILIFLPLRFIFDQPCRGGADQRPRVPRGVRDGRDRGAAGRRAHPRRHHEPGLAPSSRAQRRRRRPRLLVPRGCGSSKHASVCMHCARVLRRQGSTRQVAPAAARRTSGAARVAEWLHHSTPAAVGRGPRSSRNAASVLLTAACPRAAGRSGHSEHAYAPACASVDGRAAAEAALAAGGDLIQVRAARPPGPAPWSPACVRRARQPACDSLRSRPYD